MTLVLRIFLFNIASGIFLTIFFVPDILLPFYYEKASWIDTLRIISNVESLPPYGAIKYVAIVFFVGIFSWVLTLLLALRTTRPKLRFIPAVISLFFSLIGFLAFLPCSGEGCLLNAIVFYLISVPGWYAFLQIIVCLSISGLVKKNKNASVTGILIGGAAVFFVISFYFSYSCISLSPKSDCYNRRARLVSQLNIVSPEVIKTNLCEKIDDRLTRENCLTEIDRQYLSKNPEAFIEEKILKCQSLPYDDHPNGSKRTCYAEIYRYTGLLTLHTGRPRYIFTPCILKYQIQNKLEEDNLIECVKGSVKIKNNSDYLNLCSRLHADQMKNCYESFILMNSHMKEKVQLCEQEIGRVLKSIMYTDIENERIFTECLIKKLLP